MNLNSIRTTNIMILGVVFFILGFCIVLSIRKARAEKQAELPEDDKPADAPAEETDSCIGIC